MNEDINLRIQFIQEVQRHPYLYDHNHFLYNHRDKIEATWHKIGLMFGEESQDCKKKWRLIRCSYTRSLKVQAKQKSVLGLAKGYYMAPHLRFLDPFLKSRSYVESSLQSEDDEFNETAEESMEAGETNTIFQVSLDNVKEENDDDDVIEQYEATESIEVEDDNEELPSKDSQKSLLERKRTHSSEEGEITSNCISKKTKPDNNGPLGSELSASEMFLLSLSPFLDGMTERQRLTFQKGAMELIEKIKYDS